MHAVREEVRDGRGRARCEPVFDSARLVCSAGAPKGTTVKEIVEIREVTVVRKTEVALLCRIGNENHWIALSRLQPGSALDMGRVVLERDFAVERGLHHATRSIDYAPRTLRCERLRLDGTPCLASRRTGSSFCFAHDPATAEEREAGRARGRANARDAFAERRKKLKW